MAKIETEITIKVCDEELNALYKLLYFQVNNPSDVGLSYPERDILNGVFFSIQDSIGRQARTVEHG